MLPGSGLLVSLLGGNVSPFGPLPAAPGDGAKPGMSGLEPSLDVPQAAASRASSEMEMGSRNKRARADDVMNRASLLESDVETLSEQWGLIRLDAMRRATSWLLERAELYESSVARMMLSNWVIAHFDLPPLRSRLAQLGR
jgi:hypothetical protein